MVKIDEIITSLTLEEKVSLCSGKDFWQTQNIDRLGVPSAFLADGPHGIRKQAAAADHLGLNESLKATCFPTAAGMANSWNPELAEELGAYLGAEARAQGVNMLLGPGINVKRSPLCGRNFEYFSEDPYLAGQMAAAYIRGIQSAGVSACVKHFAVNSQETRRMVSDSVIDERTLRELYLTNFEIAVIQGGAKAVMTSYNLVNGTYANENEHLLLDILRGEWGYDGVVVTDWGGSNDRVSGLKAGNELEMPGTGGITNLDILNAVKNGELEESVLDAALKRLLTFIFDTDNALKDKPAIDVEEHHAAAVRAAEESLTLLENDGILPLSPGAKVCVIGCFAKEPRYQGAGSSMVNPTRLDTVMDCIGEYNLNNAGYAEGFKRYGGKSEALLNEAVDLANKADVVLLFLGLDEITETEGLDRSNMTLPANQLELINALKATGKKIAAVLSCGAPVEMGWTEGLNAVAHAYLGGQGGARAALNILSGRACPSGKLAETYPHKYSDCPSAKYFPGRARTAEYREGPYIGYRYYQTAGVNVKYPFGYGMSYTSFAYADITAGTDGVTFTVTNTGDRDGAETAQMYISKPDSALHRPALELKGFTKVFLRKGESRVVTIPFDDYSFRVFDVDAGCWANEAGAYVIHIGSSSADIRLSEEYSIDGVTLCPKGRGKAQLPSYYAGKAADVGVGEFETLLGRKAPGSALTFVKKNRIHADANTPVCDLKYAKGWTGRLFEGGLRLAHGFLRLVGNHKLAGTIMLGVYSMPLRGLSRMTGGMINTNQLNGVITMFNGKFFKGFGQFLKK